MSAGEAKVQREEQEGASQRCDFCGKVVETVRRVALDRGYDRLGPRHGVRYACAPCSEDKERERLAHPAG